VAGAYKATPIDALETETFVPPIDLYLDSRVAAFQQRLRESPSYKVIQKACQAIQHRLKLQGRRAQTKTTGQQRQGWETRRTQALGPAQEEKKRVILA
jgi:hypothetical protein